MFSIADLAAMVDDYELRAEAKQRGREFVQAEYDAWLLAVRSTLITTLCPCPQLVSLYDPGKSSSSSTSPLSAIRTLM